MTLDHLHLLRAVVMTYSQAEVQGQRPVTSEDPVETNRRMDGRTDGEMDRWPEAIALPPLLMRSVNRRV